MPRGGARPGAGRPKGSRSVLAAELERYVDEADADSLEAALFSVSENPRVPVSVRLEAMRRLFGLFSGRLVVGADSAPPDERTGHAD